MTKLSISAAAKVFDVSRPTLLNHLKSGKISGDKDPAKGWQIDTAELSRVYTARPIKGANPLPPTLPSIASPLEDDLKAKVERLERELAVAQTRAAVAQALAEDRKRLLDQSMKLLTAPSPPTWWQKVKAALR